MSSIIKVNEIQDGGGNTILSSDGSGTVTQTRTGIIMADNWRLTTSQNQGSDANITSGWERNDSATYSSIGTGLTESSGIFSFPQTGLYLISYSFAVQQQAGDDSSAIFLDLTQDNSTYTAAAEAFTANSGTGTGNSNVSNFTFFNVTDTTNDKFVFRTNGFSTNTSVLGNTTRTRTGFYVLRIGDSQ